jgi:dUTP pyrophosphatase
LNINSRSSDFRGELKAALRMERGHLQFNIEPGDRICQGMLLPLPIFQPRWADVLTETARGEGGCGSTGR